MTDLSLGDRRSTPNLSFSAVGDGGVLAVLAVGAVVLFAASTPLGIGIRPDSAYYLGFPVIVHPNAPAYAWLLSLVAETGPDRIAAAKVINASMFAANAALLYVAVRVVSCSRLFGALAAAAMVTSPLVLSLHATVLSEALCLFLMLVAVVSLARAVELGSPLVLIVSAMTAGLCVLTRFNALPLVVLGPLSLLLLGRRGALHRIALAALYLVVAIAPIAVWLALQDASGGDGTGRAVGLYGNPSVEVLMQGVTSVWVSFMPSSGVPWAVQAAGVAALVVGVTLSLILTFVALARRDAGEFRPLATLPFIAALFFGGYLAFLLLAIVVEANLPLKPSYMLPAFVMALIALAGLVGRGAPAPFHRAALRAPLYLLLIAVVAANCARSAALVTEFRSEGNFYASKSWRASPTIAELASLDPSLTIYSNAAEAVHYLLPERAVAWVPMAIDRRTGEPMPSFAGEMATLEHKLASGTAVVAFFDSVDWRFYMLSEEEFTEDFPVAVTYAGADGRVYAGQASRLISQGRT